MKNNFPFQRHLIVDQTELSVIINEGGPITIENFNRRRDQGYEGIWTMEILAIVRCLF